MKKLLILAGIAGAIFAVVRLMQGWRDDTPSARQLKDVATDTKEFLTEDPTEQRNPAYSMG